MAIKAVDYLHEKIHDQNVYSIAQFQSLKLAFFLRSPLRGDLAPALLEGNRHSVAFTQSVEELSNHVLGTKPDAVVVDITSCHECGCSLACLRTACEHTADIPVIGIGPDRNETIYQQAFEVGIEDLIPKSEASPQHILRVISYAVVRNRNLQKVRAFERRHVGLIENATEGIFQTTPEGRYILANPALANLYGYKSPHELMMDLTNIGTQLYVDPNRRMAFSDEMLEKDQVINFESQINRKDGSVIWIAENARAVRDEEGQLLYYEGFVRDITDRKNHEAQLLYLAQRDALTGLPNRTLFNERLSEAIVQAERVKGRVGVLFIDLDNFKGVNDTLGHPVGDAVLRRVAKRLVSSTGIDDTVARLSGDEFAIVLSDVPDAQVVTKIAERLLEAISAPINVAGRRIHTSGSIGVTLYPDYGVTIDELMQNADTAAYSAKNMGRNTYQFYSESLSVEALRRLNIENGLRLALRNHELNLVYQPKVDLLSGAIVGAEALLRWSSPELGPVSPSEFIPIAEESGLITQLGDWVFQQVCRQTANWLQLGYAPGRIALNFSAKQFRRPDLFGHLKQVIEDTNVPVHHLELELTESALVEHSQDAAAVLSKLTELGMTISIDDFGTGYSSLSYLKKFPISTLKIDRAFIKETPFNQEDAAIVRAVVSLGESLDLPVVAEGIEQPNQRQFLEKLGCHYGQGFLFSRPVSPAVFGDMLAANKRFS